MVSCYKWGGDGDTRAKGLSPAAQAVPAQRRRPGGWKTALWAHLGSSCRAGPEWVTWRTGQAYPDPGACKAKALGNMLDGNHVSRGVLCRPASGARPPGAMSPSGCVSLSKPLSLLGPQEPQPYLGRDIATCSMGCFPSVNIHCVLPASPCQALHWALSDSTEQDSCGPCPPALAAWVPSWRNA